MKVQKAVVVKKFAPSILRIGKTSEPIFLKFCNIVHECKCQLLMWSINFSCAKKTIKSPSESGGNFINKNCYVQKISYLILFFALIFNVLVTSALTFHFPYVISLGLSIFKCISPSLHK